jgi:hypothetical protein
LHFVFFFCLCPRLIDLLHFIPVLTYIVFIQFQICRPTLRYYLTKLCIKY